MRKKLFTALVKYLSLLIPYFVICVHSLAQSRFVPTSLGYIAKLDDEVKRERKFQAPPVVEEQLMLGADLKVRMKQFEEADPLGCNITLFEALLAHPSEPVRFHELIVKRSEPAITRLYVEHDDVAEPVDVIRYTTSYSEQKEISGPTLLMLRDGKKHLLELKNELLAKEEPVLTWIRGLDPAGPTDYWKMDNAHELFSTNLHMHGLHISPGGRQDNVFLDLPPTDNPEVPNELFLDFQLPVTHTAGTFWYHAHRHGAVAYQVANGMAGALIVPGDCKNRSDLESVPEVEKANHIPGLQGGIGRVMLLQQFVFAKTTRVTSDGAAIWVVDPGDLNDREFVDPQKNTETIVADIIPNLKHRDVLTTNGVQAPTIKINKGSIERWRFIHAGKESEINVEWLKKEGNHWVKAKNDAITMYEIAIDGIPTGDFLEYDNQEDAKKGTKHLRLQPGYRCDLLVQVNDVRVGDIYALATEESPRLDQMRFLDQRHNSLMNVRPNVPPSTVAIIKVAGEGYSMPLPDKEAFSRWKPQELPPVNPRKILGFHMSDDNEFGISENVSPDQGAKPYAQTSGLEQIALKIGQNEQWALSVDLGSHPFHMHVNPFQVQQVLGKDAQGNDITRWIWRDTLLISREKGAVNIRFTPTDFAGRSVLHCHILDHEDQGMMKEIFIDSNDPSQFPGLAFLKHSTDDVPLPDIIKPDGKPQVLVVFRGVMCSHCVAALRDLARVSTHLQNAEVTAISTNNLPSDVDSQIGAPVDAPFKIVKKIADAALLKKLGVPGGDATEHAVIIWDKNGKETYRYMGREPLPDNYEAVYALRSLQQ
jgi:FtsP/CotA-like multicopper oxidase with cupredoxin domain/peroxiredoxin